MNENQLTVVRNHGEPAPVPHALVRPLVREPVLETTPLENYRPTGRCFVIDAAVAQKLTMGISGWLDRETLSARQSFQSALLGLLDQNHAVELTFQFDAEIKAARYQLLHDGRASPTAALNRLFGAALRANGCFVLSSSDEPESGDGSWHPLRYEAQAVAAAKTIGFNPNAEVMPFALPKWSSKVALDSQWVGRAFDQVAQLKWEGEIRVRVRKAALTDDQLAALEAHPMSRATAAAELLVEYASSLAEVQVSFRRRSDEVAIPDAVVAFSSALLPHRMIARDRSIQSDLVDLQPIESVPLLLPSPADWVNQGGRRSFMALHPLPQAVAVEGCVIGEVALRNGAYRNITLPAKSMCRHVYLRGQSGTGKTEFLFNLAMNRALAGESVVVIDPHGDLCARLEQVLCTRFPQRLSVLSPGRADSVRCNPLDLGAARSKREKQALANILKNEFITIEKLMMGVDENNSGPGREQVLGAGLLLAMSARHDVTGRPFRRGGATLNDLRDVIRNRQYRRKLLADLPSSFLSREIQKDLLSVFEDLEKTNGEQSLDNWIFYLVNKLGKITTDQSAAGILCQRSRSLNMRKLIDGGGILLVNLSKGRIGQDVAQLIGALTLRNVFRAALSRADQNEDERRPVTLIADEFQNFINRDIGAMFAEARKYRLNLVVAHQSASQLWTRGGGDLLAEVMTNSANKLFFRLGPQDAEQVESLLAPQFDRSMLTRLDDFHAVAQMQLGNRLVEPFVMRTIPWGAA